MGIRIIWNFKYVCNVRKDFKKERNRNKSEKRNNLFNEKYMFVEVEIYWIG